MKAKKKSDSTSIAIKLIITAILGALSITYILYKPPTSEITSYKKQSMPKPYSYSKDNDSSSFSAESAADDDAISLTGKKGSYDQQIIGGENK